MTFHILGRIIPTDELICFRGVAKNHQTAIINDLEIVLDVVANDLNVVIP
jgi:hypothetical protein